MAITIAQVIEGLVREDAGAKVNKINDAIDALSYMNQKVTNVANIVKTVDTDANSITILNADGTVASGSIASSSARTYKSVEINMPLPYVKTITIPRYQFEQFGITPQMLDTNASRFGIDKINAMVSSGYLAEELQKLYADFTQFRRNQVHTLLSGLATTTVVYQNTPDSDKLVADSRTGNLYDFDNKATASLSDSEFKVGLNAIAKQIDSRGNEIGAKSPQFLFHTSNLTLANEILKPHETINVNYRSAGDFKGGVAPAMKFAGVYNNGSDVNDWIILAEGHKIERYTMKGYESPIVRVYHDVENDVIGIEMSDRTIMTCIEPTCIYGGIVS